MEIAQLILLGFAGFFLAIMSGIAGGGGGLVMTPLLIFLGLTPAESISTGKLAGLSLAIGSLAGMKSRGSSTKKFLLVLAGLSIIAGAISARVIVGIDNDAYMKILGVMLILIAPLMHFRKLGHQSSDTSPLRKALGFVGVFFFLLLQGIFSSGLGIFVNLAMMSGLGMSVIESNIARRVTQVVMNLVVIIGVLSSGLIIWNVALVLIGVNFVGSVIGGKIAIKKGDVFVSRMLAILTLISGVALLI